MPKLKLTETDIEVKLLIDKIMPVARSTAIHLGYKPHNLPEEGFKSVHDINIYWLGVIEECCNYIYERLGYAHT